MSRRWTPYDTQTPAQSDQAEAYALGRARQVRAATERDSDDADDLVSLEHEKFMQRLDRVSREAPAARTAWWLIHLQGIEPVPLDRELQPVGDPLCSPEAVVEHFRDHPHHAVGIATGKHPIRPWSFLAVEVDRFSSWNEWVRDASAVTQMVPDLGGFADLGDMAEVGPPKKLTSHRDPGGYARLLWVPPPLPQMKRWKLDATGGPLMDAMKTRSAGRGGWIWMAVPDPDGQLTVKKDRDVAPGVRVLSTGTVVPWEMARTVDGWTLRLQAPPASQQGLAPPLDAVAPWLLEALTGKDPR